MSFYKEVPGRQTTLESTLKFDTTPTAGSTNPVTSDGVNTAITESVGSASEALQEQIDDIAEKAGSGYIPKGEADVATLNGLSGQENGWLYTMTDAGTLTEGSLAVVAGDTVAWDEANSVWYKAMDYAPSQYGTNEVHNLPTTITAFRTGDVISVDGSNGPAKMGKDDLLKETAENALASVASIFNPSATYTAGTWVIYNGKLYNTLNTHTGAWSALDFLAVSVESRVGYVIASLAPLFNKNSSYIVGSFVTRFGRLYRATSAHRGDWNAEHFAQANIMDMIALYNNRFDKTIKNKYKLFFDGQGSFVCKKNELVFDVSDADKRPFGIVDWLLPMKCIFDASVTKHAYVQFGSFSGSYDPYDDEQAIDYSARTSFAYSGETGCKLLMDYATTGLNATYIFYFSVNEKTGLLEYHHNKSVGGQPSGIEIEPNFVFSIIFAKTGNGTITSSEIDSVSVEIEKYSPIETAPLLKASVLTWVQGGISIWGIETTPDVNYWNRIRTGYLEVNDVVSVKFDDSVYKLRYFVYDSGKVFETWSEHTTSPFIASPAIGKYVRFCFLRKDDANISCHEGYEHIVSASGVDGVVPALARSDYSTQKFLEGKKVVFLGDSITYGYNATDNKGFVDMLAQETGASCVNLGYAGTCIANNTTNGMSDNRFVTRATSANFANADLIVVFGGTNDFSYDSKAIGDLFDVETITPSDRIGDKKKVAVSDTDTFAGALHELITTIQTNAPTHCKIMFITPLKRGQYATGRPNAYESNPNGDFLEDFATAIKGVCEYYSIPVLDLYAVGINPLSALESNLFADTLHPNDAGHRVLAETIAKYIKDNITFIG